MNRKSRKTRSGVKDANVLNTRKPLAPTHKSKGFSFCRRQVHWGVDVSPTTNALIRLVLMTAQSSGRISRTRRWVDAHWGFLRRADDAYTGTDGKRKALIRGYSNQGCAHDCSARFALQGVRRSRPRWELSGLISLGRIARLLHVWNNEKVIKLIVLRALNPLTKRTFT